MSATLLTNELNSLLAESKRKNPELKSAAEKSLQELKSLPVTSEQQLAADLSRRPVFIEPFLIACATRNTKFASAGVTSLQRLIIAKGLPKSRLRDALDALNACTDLGLDIQLKVLQALPSLLQNYSDDLTGDLLSGALQVCSSLQSAKVQTVSGVASATLQQLVTSVFEKVADEDERGTEIIATHEVPSSDQPTLIRPAAYDAYRVFRDLVLAAEDKNTKFVQFSSLSQDYSLELIYSCMNAHPDLINSHVELSDIVRSNVLPLATQALSQKLMFSTTVRCLRILDLVIGRYLRLFPDECEVALNLAYQGLDADATPSWKRPIVMEMLRNFLVGSNHAVDSFALFDMSKSRKSIVQDIMAAFVRMSAEKPSAIGLGLQSTLPVGPTATREQMSQELSLEAAGSVAGVISSALGVAEVNVAGISSQWSLLRTPCLEILDKTEPAAIPETYVYALVLECLTGISDNLAKVVIPLTVQHGKSRLRSASNRSVDTEAESGLTTSESMQSHYKKFVPLNPLKLENHASTKRVNTVAKLVEACWPAVLATASTFLNAALDDQYYRNLIKAYQRFAQVAGLLRLSTARDALMTTLGKAAVSQHILNNLPLESPKTPVTESPRSLSHPKSLLSVDGLLSPSATDKEKRSTSDGSKPMLTTRNLLCLRALLNLAIALGPTLDTAFAVVIETLRQTDTVLSWVSPRQIALQGLNATQKQTDSPLVVQAFSNEVAAVEAAASRLLESTADYPDYAFVDVMQTFCRLIPAKGQTNEIETEPAQVVPDASPQPRERKYSAIPGLSITAGTSLRDYKFAIPKLGHLAKLNISRFAFGQPTESGWDILVNHMISLASDGSNPKEVRGAATDVLCQVAAETIFDVSNEDPEVRATVQRRALDVLLRIINSIYAGNGELNACDIEVQGHVVDRLKSIVERCGDSLIAGWNRTVAILSSVFERNGTMPERQNNETVQIDWDYISHDLISVSLGRTAFAAVQLICSDFLSTMPTAVMPALIELFHRFASQTDDLNIALTTITIAWNVSDYLLSNFSSKDIDDIAITVQEADDPVEEIEKAVQSSVPVLWLLLLLRIQDIIRAGQKEVRKAAFQTLCSIFKNHGDDLTPRVWNLTLRMIVLRILFDDATAYSVEEGDNRSVNSIAERDESISITMMMDISGIIVQHLRSIEQVPQLPGLWESFLSRLEAYLDVQQYALDTAVYRAITRVVSGIEPSSKIWSGPMYRTLHLWLKRNPAVRDNLDGGAGENALIAYTETGKELYRLTQQNMSVPQTKTLVENLYQAVKHESSSRLGPDVNNLNSLQSKVLDFLQAVKSSDPSILVAIAARLVGLHRQAMSHGLRKEGSTFVAISSEAISWIQSLILRHLHNAELFEGGSITKALKSLRELIECKYILKLEHKTVPLWRKATECSLALANSLMTKSQESEFDPVVKSSLCFEYARIAGGIVSAMGINEIDVGPSVYEDERTDIQSFKQLRDVFGYRFGDVDLPDEIRICYTQALFNASIIHLIGNDVNPADVSSLFEVLQQTRRGRMQKAPCAFREEMAYECLTELVALSSKSDGSVERRTLARSAVPSLVQRLAMPIKAYIADQPLRGCRPQPLSEVEELLKCLDIIKTFRCDPDALGPVRNDSQWRGEQAHLHYLYPLMIKALAVAADKRAGGEILWPLQAVIEATTCGNCP